MIKKSILITLITILYTSQIFGLNFQVSELISIPGNNKNLDIIQDDCFSGASHICWENITDSVYSIYLKQIQPTIGENLIVYSSTGLNINPQIAFNRYAEGIKIIWQSKIDGRWQLLQKNFLSDTLSQIILISDSLLDSTKYSLSTYRIAYINDGNLMVKSFYPDCEGYNAPILVDSGYCTNPDIASYDYYSGSSIVYEKGLMGETQIYKAEYSYFSSEDKYDWVISKVSIGTNNINPTFGYCYGITYQTLTDNVWRFVLTELTEYTSNNTTCNFYNPTNFSYPIPVKGLNGFTPFFIAFDSDSLTNNQEIFIQTYFYGPEDTIINISNSLGFDSKPSVTLVSDSITIMWEHEENSKTDIWWAKEEFNPIWGGINDKDYGEPSIFSLNQNYPNPFNPSTTISFQVKELISKKADIKIYNTLGQIVRIISKNINSAGYYFVTWDGKSDDGSVLPTGNYFYHIYYGHSSVIGKMTLVK